MFVCMCVCQSDEDFETYDTLLELDELLNFDSDAERTAYIEVICTNTLNYSFFTTVAAIMWGSWGPDS